MNVKEQANHYICYLEYERKLSPATILSYTKSLKRLKDFSEEGVKDFIFHNGCGAKTVRCRLDIVRGLIKWCIQQGTLDKDPTKNIVKPKLPQRQPDCLDVEEVRQLLACFNNGYPKQYRQDDELMVKFLLYAGLRKGEFTRLRFSDIHDGYIYVRQGKGGKDRTVPLHQELELIGKAPKFAPPLDYLLCYHGKPVCATTIERAFLRLRLNSGIKRLHPHLLRHTFATMIYRNGTDLATLQELLGHTSIATTRIYITVSPAHLNGAIKGLGF